MLRKPATCQKTGVVPLQYGLVTPPDDAKGPHLLLLFGTMVSKAVEDDISRLLDLDPVLKACVCSTCLCFKAVEVDNLTYAGCLTLCLKACVFQLACVVSTC